MAASVVYEAMEFREPALEPGQPFPGTQESVIGESADQVSAIDTARAAWFAFREAPTKDVMWWLVRERGQSMALWIADGHSGVERVLDLTTKQLVEVI